MKKYIIILCIVVVFISILLFARNWAPLPIGLRHFLNITFKPKDLYQPIVLDKFAFQEKYFSKTYLLKAKHHDIYEIGIEFENGGIISSYKFNGKIKCEFFLNNQLVSEKIISSVDSALYFSDDLRKFKQLSFLKFNIPFENQSSEDLSVKLTVLEPDQELEQYKDRLKLYVAVSSVP